MSYLTVINDKGYQEYIDDVARGLEAEEQQKLAIDGNSYQVPQISIGKILLIGITIIISTALIFIAVAVCLRGETEEEEEESQTINQAREVVIEQRETVWNCNGEYTSSPTDKENCTIITADNTVDENGTRSITPNAPSSK